MLREDFETQTWKRLRTELEARLAALRSLNDNPSNNTESTALIRGQIKEVKRILSLGNPSESPEVEREDGFGLT